ncbi:MAG: TVP38/TMEM64 family protein [Eubacteriales bacterium]|nr:TVP38/TMEM64 family protein [Eubacteriales bacterium]
MKNKKVWIFIGIVVIMFVLNKKFGWSKSIDNMDVVWLQSVVQNNFYYAAVLYLGLTVIGCVVLALPGVTFAIVAGIMFGPFWGTVFCLVATTLGAVLSFLAGRFFLKDAIKPVVLKNKYLKRWLFEDTKTQGMFLLMITRLIPLFPYNLQNFAYGITDIPFSTYTAGTFLFMIPGTAMYTVGAAGLLERENKMWYIGIAAFFFCTVLGVGTFLKKKYLRESEE